MSIQKTLFEQRLINSSKGNGFQKRNLKENKGANQRQEQIRKESVEATTGGAL